MFGRYADAVEASSDAKWHAIRVLRMNNLPVKTVVGVDVDSILWISQTGKPHTAWLFRDEKGALHIKNEPGFQIERSK